MPRGLKAETKGENLNKVLTVLTFEKLLLCWVLEWRSGCSFSLMRNTENVFHFLSSSSLFPLVPSRTLACGTRPRKHNKRGSVASVPCSLALPWGPPDHRSQATCQTGRMSRPASKNTSNWSHSVLVNYPHLLCQTRLLWGANRLCVKNIPVRLKEKKIC